MPANYEDESTSAAVQVIRDLNRDVNEFKRVITKRVDEYEHHTSVDRAAFQASIQASLVQMRNDFNRALQPILLSILDDDKRVLEDKRDREKRQAEIDSQFTAMHAKQDQQASSVDQQFREVRIAIYVLALMIMASILVGIVLWRFT